MASVQSIYRTARTLGDYSSLKGGTAGPRIFRRASGKVTSKILSFNVWGLIAWTMFFDLLREAVQLANAKEMWIVSASSYIKGYDKGFTPGKAPGPKGRRKPPDGYGFWAKGVNEAFQDIAKGQTGGGPRKVTGLRSGLYIGGRFMADIRSVARGKVGMRILRRSAGASATRLFWGTLMNPERNVLHPMAVKIQAKIRKYIRKAKLVDSKAMVMSVEIGQSKREAIFNSVFQIRTNLLESGQGKDIEKSIAPDAGKHI